MSVSTYQLTGKHLPGDLNLHQEHDDNFKYLTVANLMHVSTLMRRNPI